MYLHWIWSVALLAGVVALYWFVIRPKAPFLETRTHIENWFARRHDDFGKRLARTVELSGA